ncbi:MAG TPA: Rieske 2Fe-2S domain-containing protein [Stellaceae bacterium]|nr:Rieske 2Fe-2S domain-containing protein [Stellaceae bacterium]
MRNDLDLNWPREGLRRVPYDVYRRDDIYAEERERIFQGPTWNYLCLDIELPNPGDYRATFVGDVPVIVARHRDGTIHAFENRCLHRGAMLCLKPGNAKEISCVYHNWTYDLTGKLTGVAFQRGVNGKGGMPPEFSIAGRHLRALRVANFAGLVFGTFADETPDIETYLGPEIAARIRRVMCKPIRPLGGVSQYLHSNWKIYADNLRDSYHASLLHMFFTTFKLNRLSMQGGIIVNEQGGNHVSYSKMATDTNVDYDAATLRAKQEDFGLEDKTLLRGRDEFGDGVTLQILTVFPGFIMHQIQNSLAVRQILPKGVGETELNWTYFGFEDDDAAMRDTRLRQTNLVGPGGYISMEDGAVVNFVQRTLPGGVGEASIVEMGGSGTSSQDTRVTESAVRGFWRVYRERMGI